MTDIGRRQLLKGVVGGLSVAAFVKQVRAQASVETDVRQAYKPSKPVTAITLGAGNRGGVYGSYAQAYPQHLNIIGVAEPVAYRNERYAEVQDIAASNRFQTWEDVFARPKFADAIIITTPDALHFGPAMAALKAGYDVLLEKPVSPSLDECMQIRDLANKTGQIVAVCHVLRYTDYFRELKSLLGAGAVGELVSMQHMEPIQHEHMAHSYVRGNWHDAKATTPIILGKSCHDLDILRWLADRPCEKITAFGDLKWFRSENQPEGSTERCLDGCAIERECPYSAKKLYLEKSDWSYVFDLPEDPERSAVEKILSANAALSAELRSLYARTGNTGDAGNRLLENADLQQRLASALGPNWQKRLNDYVLDNGEIRQAAKRKLLATTNYGRCVYRMENDQPDHYVTSIQFADSVTASFSMEAFTAYHGRRTRIMGSMGDIVGDQKTMRHTDFRTGEVSEWAAPVSASGHGGGDHGLVFDWVRAVASRDSTLLSSSIDVSIESHQMAFKAEASRKRGTVERVT